MLPKPTDLLTVDFGPICAAVDGLIDVIAGWELGDYRDWDACLALGQVMMVMAPAGLLNSDGFHIVISTDPSERHAAQLRLCRDTGALLRAVDRLLGLFYDPTPRLKNTPFPCLNSWGPPQNLRIVPTAPSGAADQLRRILDRLRSSALGGAAQPDADGGGEAVRDSNMLISLGNCLYDDFSKTPVLVDDTEDNVLQSFLDLPAMSESTLIEKSGVQHASKVLKRLAMKYDGRLARFISLPGKKCAGGYSVRILRSLESFPNRAGNVPANLSTP